MRKKNKRIRDLNNSKKSIYQQKGKGQGGCRKSTAILKITKKYYLLLFTQQINVTFHPKPTHTTHAHQVYGD